MGATELSEETLELLRKMVARAEQFRRLGMAPKSWLFERSSSCLNVPRKRIRTN